MIVYAWFLMNVLIVTAFARLLENQRRSHARERDLILNQLLHATGNTWTPPPAEPRQEPEAERPEYQPSPEQYTA